MSRDTAVEDRAAKKDTDEARKQLMHLQDQQRSSRALPATFIKQMNQADKALGTIDTALMRETGKTLAQLSAGPPSELIAGLNKLQTSEKNELATASSNILGGSATVEAIRGNINDTYRGKVAQVFEKLTGQPASSDQGPLIANQVRGILHQRDIAHDYLNKQIQPMIEGNSQLAYHKDPTIRHDFWATFGKEDPSAKPPQQSAYHKMTDSELMAAAKARGIK